jgi:hypothetical protein
MKKIGLFVSVCVLSVVLASSGRAAVQLKPANTVSGYLALLLLNETPFPGESGWVSEQDTKDAMLSILWVLHSRLDHVPQGYRRKELAATSSDNLIDVITVGGEKGQCDGFYRDANGHFVAVPRVHKRIDYLVGIAGKGKPGRFASLLNYGQGLADAYMVGGKTGADRYAHLRRVGNVSVTGRAYSWMTGKDCYHPGGDFVKIPDSQAGLSGGNRFFTLKDRTQ